MKKVCLLFIFLIVFFMKTFASTGGTIGPSVITVYSGSTTEHTIAYTTQPTGGLIVAYKWFKKTISGPWEEVLNSDNDTLKFSGLTVSSNFKCIATLWISMYVFEDVSSNTIDVNVVEPIQPGVIDGPDLICSGSTANLTFTTGPTGGTGSYSYQWQEPFKLIIFNAKDEQDSKNSSTQEKTTLIPIFGKWTDIAGANSSSYTTPVLKGNSSYRCIVDGGAGGKSTNVFVVYIDSVKAKFSPNIGSVEIGGEVQFIDSSINADSYNWDLGNGITSTLSEPSVYYYDLGGMDVKLTVTSPIGCIDTLLKEDVVMVTQVHVNSYNNIQESELSIYPQPANNFIHVDMPETDNFMVIFYDIAGRIVMERNLQTSSTLDISDLPSGNYTIHANTNDGKSYIGKLLKN